MKPQLDFIAAHIQHNNVSIEWSRVSPDQRGAAKSWLMHKIAPFMSPSVFTPIYINYPKPALLIY